MQPRCFALVTPINTSGFPFLSWAEGLKLALFSAMAAL